MNEWKSVYEWIYTVVSFCTWLFDTAKNYKSNTQTLERKKGEKPGKGEKTTLIQRKEGEIDQQLWFEIELNEFDMCSYDIDTNTQLFFLYIDKLGGYGSS